jgi:hypothetical protein
MYMPLAERMFCDDPDMQQLGTTTPRTQMKTTRTAINLIERFRDHYARVHVLVASDGVDHLRAQAVCSCNTPHTRHRNEADPDIAVQRAADDGFRHFCTTGHRMATPLVRAPIHDAQGAYRSEAFFPNRAI